MQKVVRKSGLKVGMEFFEKLGLKEGAIVEIDVDGRTILIRPTGEIKAIAPPHIKKEKELGIRCIEIRNDMWFDFTERITKEGEVRFYKVKHKDSGEWIFKAMIDPGGKVTVQVVKCPAGIWSPLEGDSMVFQPAKYENMVYNIISTAYLKDRNIKRDQKEHLEDVPEYIVRESKIILWAEATGKENPRYANHPVTLIQKNDYKGMVKQFMLQRVYPISMVQK